MVTAILVAHDDQSQAPEQARNSRTTCIAVAAERGFVDVVRLLLDAGARQALPREGTTVYDTPLATAAAAGHLDTVRLLLETGVDKDRDPKPCGRKLPQYFC